MQKKRTMKKSKKNSQVAQEGKKSKVRWKLDEAFLYRRDLKHISRKMKKISELKSREDLEKPRFTIEQIWNRLQERKRDLIKKISMNDEDTKKFVATLRSSNTGLDIVELASMTFEEYQARLIRPNLGTLLWTEKTCDADQGLKKFDWFFPYAWKQTDLHHGSDASFSAECELFDRIGGYVFRGELNDNASIWRDDDPDSISWGQEIGWILPRAECDARAICHVGVQIVSEFTNSADDGGCLWHHVHFAHSDRDGNLPREAKVGGLYDDIIWRCNSGHSDSGGIGYTITFDVNAGVEGKLSVILGTSLSAQDGLVEVIGSWSVDRYVSYTLLPK